MLLNRGKIDEREPIGIVISDGGPPAFMPRLSAFVWGPVPDDVDGPVTERGLVSAV